MSARALVLVSLLLSGCGAGSACDGQAGSCVELTVRGAGLEVDMLFMQLTVGAQHAMAQTVRNDRAVPLPATIAVLLPGIAGDARLLVRGLSKGQVVGSTNVAVTIRAGEHSRLTVDLATPTDGGTKVDAASMDAGAVDAGAVDAAARDAAITDLAAADMSGDVHRLFLTGGYLGNLEIGTSADVKCQTYALNNSLSGTYLALVSTPTHPDPVTRFSFGIHHKVINLTGQVIASDGNFWTSSHDGPILSPQGAALGAGTHVWSGMEPDGHAITASCPGGSDTNAPCNCLGWTSPGQAEVGYVGMPTSTFATWANSTSFASCDNTLYIMCLER